MSLIPYESRSSAGEILAKTLLKQKPDISDAITQKPDKFFAFAVPNGGVPVVEGFCNVFKIHYDILIVRKIKIPYNPEAGFGSITTDGTIILNNQLLSQLHLRKDLVEDAIEQTKEEIQARLNFYNKKMPINYTQNVNKKSIFLFDDGLASGYTMLAAVKMINSYNPKSIIIMVPTAPLRTIKLFDTKVDSVICPNVRKTPWFAVADAYKHWYDLSESEVKDVIHKSQYYKP